MSWISWDYWCEPCNHKWTEINKKEDVVDVLPCPKCSGEAKRMYTCVGMQFINMPQGGRNRFADVREREALKRAKNKSGDIADIQKINREMNLITKK